MTKPANVEGRVGGVGSNFGPRLRSLLGPQLVEHLAKIHTLELAGRDFSAFDAPAVGSIETALWQLNRARRIWEDDRGEDLPLLEVAANWLRAAARAMQEVVLPAVDPAHPLAREQAALVAKYLSLFAQRIDQAGDRERFELVHHLDLARSQLDDARALSPAIAAALEGSVRAAAALRDQPGARSAAVQSASQELAALLTALVRTAASAEPPLRGRIESRVLDASRQLLDMQRAWFLPQGWEPDPTAVPPIDQVFDAIRPGA